jgi:hypothetical protein
MGLFRVTISGLQQGQTMQNVLHFKKDASSTADLNALAVDIRDNWIQYVKTIQSGSMTYVNIKVARVNNSDVPVNLTISIPGANSGNDQWLTFYSHVMQFHTAHAGRTGRGRIYHFGLANNLHDKGLLWSGVLALWAPIITNIMNRYGPSGSSDFQLYVAPHGTDETAGFPVTSITMNPVVRMQRRRNIGVGV